MAKLWFIVSGKLESNFRLRFAKALRMRKIFTLVTSEEKNINSLLVAVYLISMDDYGSTIF